MLSANYLSQLMELKTSIGTDNRSGKYKSLVGLVKALGEHNFMRPIKVNNSSLMQREMDKRKIKKRRDFGLLTRLFLPVFLQLIVSES